MFLSSISFLPRHQFSPKLIWWLSCFFQNPFVFRSLCLLFLTARPEAFLSSIFFLIRSLGLLFSTAFPAFPEVFLFFFLFLPSQQYSPKHMWCLSDSSFNSFFYSFFKFPLSNCIFRSVLILHLLAILSTVFSQPHLILKSPFLESILLSILWVFFFHLHFQKCSYPPSLSTIFFQAHLMLKLFFSEFIPLFGSWVFSFPLHFQHFQKCSYPQSSLYLVDNFLPTHLLLKWFFQESIPLFIPQVFSSQLHFQKSFYDPSSFYLNNFLPSTPDV